MLCWKVVKEAGQHGEPYLVRVSEELLNSIHPSPYLSYYYLHLIIIIIHN